MVRLLFAFFSFVLSAPLYANNIYHSNDEYGRPVFSDTPNPNGSNKIINIKIQNAYDWHNPRLNLRKSKSFKKKKKSRKKKNTYTFAQLQSKCSKARYRYQNYRGSRSNSDWGSYKAKLSRYAEKRNYWCSRVLKRK